MENLIRNYTAYLEARLKEDSDQIDFLLSEERQDEANHKKVERNVIDIFMKVFKVSQKQSQGDLEKLEKAYLGFFEKLPSNWYANLEACKKNGQEDDAYIEELKIARKDELKIKFIEMMRLE